MSQENCPPREMCSLRRNSVLEVSRNDPVESLETLEEALAWGEGAGHHNALFSHHSTGREAGGMHPCHLCPCFCSRPPHRAHLETQLRVPRASSVTGEETLSPSEMETNVDPGFSCPILHRKFPSFPGPLGQVRNLQGAIAGVCPHSPGALRMRSRLLISFEVRVGL